MVVFIALRLSLGCHFLYEGVWKIKNADTFHAAPFLSEAKGPLAPFYYSMLPDLEGRQRLGIETVADKDGKPVVQIAAERENGKVVLVEDKDDDGKRIAKFGKYKLDAYVNAWTTFKDKIVRGYGLSEEQAAQAEKLLAKYIASARSYVTENEDEIVAHFTSRDRFAADPDGAVNVDHAAHQQERDWKKEREYRQEVNAWLGALDSMGKDYQMAIWGVLTPEQQAKGQFGKGWNPLTWTRDQQIDAAVTYGLTAIGLCLMVGFFTRLAALGGAVFMLNVVMTQLAWPGLYPPDPPVVGHALIVNKDFVEMVALLLVATSRVGRWGGVDFFLHHLLVRPFLSKKFNSEKKEG